MRYYEILFTDSYGICIKSEVENPTKEQVGKFLEKDMEKLNYKSEDIESISEISIDEAWNFYDMEDEKNFLALKS